VRDISVMARTMDPGSAFCSRSVSHLRSSGGEWLTSRSPFIPAKSRPMVFLSKYLRCQRGVRRDRARHRRRVGMQVDLVSLMTGPGRTALDIRSDIGVSIVAASSAPTPSPLHSAQHCACLTLPPSPFPLPSAWLPPLHDVVHTQNPHLYRTTFIPVPSTNGIWFPHVGSGKYTLFGPG
jgi:hypothetical protein